MTKPNSTNLILTSGVSSFDLNAERLLKAINDQWESEKDEDLEGGNDKKFFVLNFEGLKMYVVYTDYTIANEEDPQNYPYKEVYTVMFPDEY